MSRQPRNPSVTTRARTGRRYWFVLALQILVGVAMAAYLAIVAVGSQFALSDLLTGVLLSLAGVLGVAIYPSLFKDAIFINRGNFEWRPRWWRYFGVGFGITFLAYVGVRTVGRDKTLAPIALLVVHIAASSFVSAVYLYNRHRSVGTP